MRSTRSRVPSTKCYCLIQLRDYTRASRRAIILQRKISNIAKTSRAMKLGRVSVSRSNLTSTFFTDSTGIKIFNPYTYLDAEKRFPQISCILCLLCVYVYVYMSCDNSEKLSFSTTNVIERQIITLDPREIQWNRHANHIASKFHGDMICSRHTHTFPVCSYLRF